MQVKQRGLHLDRKSTWNEPRKTFNNENVSVLIPIEKMKNAFQKNEHGKVEFCSDAKIERKSC